MVMGVFIFYNLWMTIFAKNFPAEVVSMNTIILFLIDIAMKQKTLQWNLVNNFSGKEIMSTTKQAASEEERSFLL